MLKLVFEGASKEINSKCVEGAKEREEYLNMAECIILKAGKPIQACNAKVNAIFEATLAKPKKDRIPLSCWYAFMSSTHKIESCANKVARQVGSLYLSVCQKRAILATYCYQEQIYLQRPFNCRATIFKLSRDFCSLVCVSDIQHSINYS